MTAHQLQELNLGAAVTELAQNMEAAMSSLFRLQTAVMNATDNSQGNILISPMRKALKEQWEGLLLYLQRCQAFGAEVPALKEALESGESDDLEEFLADMVASVKELRGSSEVLWEQSCGISQNFSGQKGMFNGVLESGSAKTLKHNTGMQRPKGKDEAQQAFIDTSLDAAYPNGFEALKYTDEALIGISAKLETVKEFWINMEKQCNSYSAGPTITLNNAEELAANWKKYETSIQEAIIIVAKTNDALPIQAIGTKLVEHAAVPKPKKRRWFFF